MFDAIKNKSDLCKPVTRALRGELKILIASVMLYNFFHQKPQ